MKIIGWLILALTFSGIMLFIAAQLFTYYPIQTGVAILIAIGCTLVAAGEGRTR